MEMTGPVSEAGATKMEKTFSVLSDVMFESACNEAESVLLDRRYFALSAEDFKRFMTMLDRQLADDAKLRRLLKCRAPWEK
jgi:uncharacterized protein (DUF1778 family)